ncbi:hypothetical protein FXV77_00910 [Sphingobacterium phlebotomi]|uniref:histidine kinase n=1 Tax=Sphingobacterium phlebotomi TaxID=2605433 RepID=A0A5D4HB51_9SPHI|nr:sensor histidine kinase [Sphingobacterium phlebotomi]TYR37878.1 hypothetical protein FXV77_00910 [Sphingobacterium phlebotomi]
MSDTQKYIVLFFISLLHISSVYSQQYYFNHYQVDQGLSNNFISCAVQDEDGFLWFGSKNGLNRFDGNQFKIYQSDPSVQNGLESNFIRQLLVYRDHTIWVGTDQGIYIFDKKKEQFHIFRDDIRGEVLSIRTDNKEQIWFVANLTLYHYTPISNQLRQLTKPEDFFVSALTIDMDGKAWYASHLGLLTCVHSQQSLNLNEVLGTKDIWVQQLYTDQQGYILAGTRSHGLLRISPYDLSVEHIFGTNTENNNLFVRDILHINQEYWVATESGIFIYNTETRLTKRLYHEHDNPWSLSDNAVYTLCQDHEGGLWAGTYFGGLNYHHPKLDLFEKIFPRNQKPSILGYAVREMVEDPYGNIWIGTEDKGISCWNSDLEAFSHYGTADGLSHNNIHGLLLIGDTLLIGTFDKGLDLFDIRQRQMIAHYDSYNTDGTLTNNFIYYIYKTRAGIIYLATGRGIHIFNPQNQTFSIFEKVPHYIFYTTIFEDAEGNIWFGTWRDGLFKYDPTIDKTTIYTHNIQQPHSLNSNRVNHIRELSTGAIWVATENGIAILNENNEDFTRITTAEGLPSNQILTFTEDDFNTLWISTSHGLVSYHIPTGSMQIYNKERGVIGLQFNYNSVFQDAHKFIYFGATGGMIRFNPKRIQHHSPSPKIPIYFTSLHVQHKEVLASNPNTILNTAIAYTHSLTLEHDQSTFSIEFAAMTFLSPQSKVYRYKLDGYDNKWITLKNSNTAYFTQVPAGKYTLCVQLTEIDGAPLSAEKTLDIVIHPSIWLSSFAYTLYGLAILSLIGYIIWSYDLRIKEKNRKRIEALKIHRERALYKAKIDFFTNIAHDIKTPLMLIKAPLRKILFRIDEQSPLLKWLHTIERNTNKLVLMTNQLLDFRKIESDSFKLYFTSVNINQLLKEIVSENNTLIQYKGIKLFWHLNAPQQLTLDQETVSKIVSNLLSNAIKYTQDYIHISTNVVADNMLSITFRNNGYLIPREEMEDIFKPFHRSTQHIGKTEGTGLGLSLARSLAELHGGTLTMLTAERENIFILKLPLQNERQIITPP